MKKILSVLLTGVILLACSAAFAEGEWYCPYCGQANDRNFCMYCGAERPQEVYYTEDDIADPVQAAQILGIGGDLLLEVTVDFEQNLFFSTYDVDMYLDDAYLATLPHGIGFHSYFSVPEGDHVLTFCENGNAGVYGATGLTLYGSTSYSCTIQAKNSQVKITSEAVDDPFAHAVTQSIERYMTSCRVPDYADISENPAKNRGKKIAVSGRVLQAVDGWYDAVFLRMEDDNGDIWYAVWMNPGSGTGLGAYDTVTLYGECTGVTTYLTVEGGSVTIPSLDVKYVALH